MVISRRSLLLAGAAFPASAYAQCVINAPAVDACRGGVRIARPAGATLDLNFMTPGTLDPRITFSRASTGTYFDAAGTMQTAGSNAPRWNYDPVSLQLKGLLLESQRTNGLRNSTMAGAAAGTPGTMPTNWSWGFGATTLSSTVAGTGTEGGIAYIDMRVSGTSAVGASIVLVPEAGNIIAAVNGQAWCASTNWRVVAGSMSGVSAAQILIRELTSAAGVIKDNTLSLTMPAATPSLAGQRTQASVVLNGGGTVAFTQPRFSFVITNGAAIDFTLRMGATQMEQGDTASSFIPTSSAAVTRAMDAASIPAAAWFNAAASSLFAEFTVAQSPNPSLLSSRSPAGISVGTDVNVIRLWAQLSNSANSAISTAIAGVNTNSPALGATTANAIMKLAGAWSGTTMAGSLNGAAPLSAAVGMPAGLNTLTLGTTSPGSTNYLNDHLRQVSYWPRVLSDAELRQVTT